MASPPRPRLQLVLDWDGTVTTEDTTAVIGEKCIEKARDLAEPGLPPEKLPKPMKHFSEQYMREFLEWKNSYASSPEQLEGISRELRYLSQSKRIEQESFLRVRHAVLDVPGGISGIELDERGRDAFMMDAGRQALRSGEVQIRDLEPLKRLIAKAEEDGNMWGIVSVSWSRRFILGALVEAGLVKGGQKEDVVARIRCNELLAPTVWDEDGDLVCISSAYDKQNALRKLLTDWNNDHNSDGHSQLVESPQDLETLTIYVGDSTTDLGCLAGSTVGMVIGNSSSLDAILARLNVKTIRIKDLPLSHASKGLSDMVAKLRSERKPPYLICRINGFQELDDWISNVT